MVFPRIATDDTIYLDHAATTPVDPEVVAAMLPYFGERYGNPSSVYRLGQEARADLDQARATVARVLECDPAEVVFTSGATESNNLALHGVAWAHRLAHPDGPPSHIVTTAIEHHAVLHAAEALVEQGFAVTVVPCDAAGIVAPRDIDAALRPETCLVSVMYANNEVGSVQPLAAIGVLARARGIPFHTDAVQAAGALPLRVDDLQVDLVSLSAHKFYGPKGVGVLFARRGTSLAWNHQQAGGGQEGGRRGGTENLPLIVGLAVALAKAERLRPAYAAHCAGLRDRMFAGVREAVPDIELNGPSDPSLRLPNNLNVAVPGVQGETVLLGLDLLGIAASAGSACTTGNSEPSHVLRAMGLTDERSRASLRFTMGRDTTADEVDEAVDALAETAARARDLVGVA